MEEAEKLRAEDQLAMLRAANLGFAGGSAADKHAAELTRIAFADER